MRAAWCLSLALGLGALAASAKADDVKTPPAKTAPAPADAEREKWAEHMGDVPFIIGFDKGMKDVEFTGRPPLVFFTADY